MQLPNKSAWPWLIVSVLIIFLDQATKYLAQTHLIPYESFPVFSWLNFTLSFNPGAAFSFLNGAGLWKLFFLAGLAIIVSVIFIVWLLKTSRSHIFLALSLSLIIGGAIGNLIDRLRYNYVVDFIDFHIKTWHFAIFNVADSAISVGAVLLILTLLFKKDNQS